MVSQLASVGPKGMAIDRFGNSVDMLYQKISWTSSGVPRKNQMNREAKPLASRSLDMRMMAMTRPTITPSIMPTTVKPRLT
ncbi:hypothetical protein D3C80_1650880 [compost metagenome]